MAGLEHGEAAAHKVHKKKWFCKFGLPFIHCRCRARLNVSEVKKTEQI